MKNKIRIAYLSFFIIFILSLFTIKVFADDEEEVSPATDPPVVTKAQVVTSPPKTKPATQAPTKKVTAATKATQYTTRKQTYATRATRSVNNNVSNNNVNNNVNRNTPPTEPTTRRVIVSSTKADTSPVYDAPKQKGVSDTLKKNDWDSIADQLKKSESDDTKTDVENFDYIKNNTSDGDNGIWILYTGIGLEIVAALIIVTLIILAVRRRKKAKFQRAGDSPRASAQVEHMASAPQRRPAPADVPRRQAHTKDQKRRINQRSKFDTDEVNINRTPRRSGGRYKPRH